MYVHDVLMNLENHLNNRNFQGISPSPESSLCCSHFPAKEIKSKLPNHDRFLALIFPNHVFIYIYIYENQYVLYCIKYCHIFVYMTFPNHGSNPTFLTLYLWKKIGNFPTSHGRFWVSGTPQTSLDGILG